MSDTYRIADVNVRVSCCDYAFRIYARDYSFDGVRPDFEVYVSRDDVNYERSQYGGELCTDSYLEALAIFRAISERMPKYDTFLFHGSAVSVDGLGYVFAAPSGTGKSTHAAMWCEMLGERAVMINDDKPMIRAELGHAEIFGTPFNGKHNKGNNIHVPLRAVCILSRGETNHIERIDSDEAYPLILRQTYRPHNHLMLAKTLTLLDRLKDSVRFYSLQCNMNPEATKVSWEAMRP